MSRVVFNKENVARYLGIDKKEIEKIIYDSSDVGTVILRNEIFKITKQQLKATIANDRRKRIEQVEIHCFGKQEYIAHNIGNINSYIIKPRQEHLECDCMDYEQLSLAYKTNQVACKHIYKYLSLLGINNLYDYIQLYDQQVENLEVA
jgi:hypothetical protein